MTHAAHPDRPRTGRGPAPMQPRPFLITSGRTRAAVAVPLESQVLTTPTGLRERHRLSFEYRELVDLCRSPLALAEVAARLRLHLGVVRVLVGDLAQQRLVELHEPVAGTLPDVATILRVIDGLREYTP